MLQAHHLPGATGQDFSPAAQPGAASSSDGLCWTSAPQPPWDAHGDVPNPQSSFPLPNSSPKPSSFILLKPHRKHTCPAQLAGTETLPSSSATVVTILADTGTCHVSFLAVGAAPLLDMTGGQQFPPAHQRSRCLQSHQVHYSSYPKSAGTSHAQGSCQRGLCCYYTREINSLMRYGRTSFLIDDAVPVFTEQGLCQEKASPHAEERTHPLGKGATAAKSGHSPTASLTRKHPKVTRPPAFPLKSVCMQVSYRQYVETQNYNVG